MKHKQQAETGSVTELKAQNQALIAGTSVRKLVTNSDFDLKQQFKQQFKQQ